jgi:hypothetical protein
VVAFYKNSLFYFEHCSRLEFFLNNISKTRLYVSSGILCFLGKGSTVILPYNEGRAPLLGTMQYRYKRL